VQFRWQRPAVISLADGWRLADHPGLPVTSAAADDSLCLRPPARALRCRFVRGGDTLTPRGSTAAYLVLLRGHGPGTGGTHAPADLNRHRLKATPPLFRLYESNRRGVGQPAARRNLHGFCSIASRARPNLNIRRPTGSLALELFWRGPSKLIVFQNYSCWISDTKWREMLAIPPRCIT
jgi:hypothetical protein